jgi:hypothetical protein
LSHLNYHHFLGAKGISVIYYLIPWSVWEVHPAFKGLAGGDGRLPYTVKYDGSKLFFKHVTTPGGISVVGLYYADVGDPTYTAHLMMPMSKLPGDQNPNHLWYLGSSEYGGSLLCRWYSSTTNSQAMWRVPTPSNPPYDSGDPIKVPLEEHNAVWDNSDLHNKIVASQIGTPEGAASALYAYRDSGQLDKLYYVDLISGEKKRLLSADGAPLTFPALYDDGYFTRVARFTGPYHKATRVNLLTGEQRDTHSYWFNESNDPYYLTDLVNDSSGTYARFYYMATKPYGQTARIHQIDMTAPPTGNGSAPLISSISFSKPAWSYQDPTPLTVTAQISDPKGRANLGNV